MNLMIFFRKVSFTVFTVFALSLVGCTPDEITLPVVNAKLSVTEITATTAVVGGVVEISDENTIISKGVCWSTSTTPTIDDSLVIVDVENGNFVAELKNLLANTTYFVRAYATDKNGTVYGESIGFFTKKMATVLTSGLISEISDTSAIVSANVVSDGGEAVIERGICMSRFVNPTIDSLRIIDSMVGTGAFNVQLKGLKLSTKYYVRGYAKTLAGVSYGNEVTFTTLEFPKTISDIEGNIYHTVKIGTQIWLVENLKTTKYNDGSSIPYNSGYNWPYLTTPAYCVAYNTISYKEDYGLIYNWYAVNTGKLTPKGWHAPTKAEIEALIAYLGGDQLAGAGLKETGNTHWVNGNNDATNISGFTALPGGYRSNATGDYQNLGYWGVFWSATESNGQAGRLIMENISSKANYALDNKAEGFSVRCIRD